MILFTSLKPLHRAENIKAVFDAYDGDKEFFQVTPGKYNPIFEDQRFAVRVTDELIGASPGKAVMIGHGFAGGKTYGLDQPHPYHRRENAQLLTYVVTTSPHMVGLVANQCGVPEDRVLPLGMPRSDAFFRTKKGDGGTVMAKKRGYLYAPTFRNRAEPPAFELNWHWIDNLLTDDEIMVVKPHMMVQHILDRNRFKHIVEASHMEPSTPYVIDCDVLITDYSSILSDAHVAGKPVVLFAKNDKYLSTRGMYLPYPDGYASRFATNEEKLVKLCREANAPQEADIKCRELTAGACDGHSSERVAKLIREMI